MSVIEVAVPIVTIEEMQAIWDACPSSTLELIDDKGKWAWSEPLHLARLPRHVGDVVEAKPVLFKFDQKAAPHRWQAILFGKERLNGSFKTTYVIKGDSIQCTLVVRGET